MNWWEMYDHKIAYKLLYMAQHGNKNERYKAVTALSSLSRLKDWQYRHLAQMLDAETAVALARMPNVDLQFFLQPPYYHIRHNLHDVLERVHSLLLRLNALCDNTHPCLTQFFSQKFKDIHRDGFVFDHDLTSMGLSVTPVTVWDKDLLKSCVRAIYHHSSVERYSKHCLIASSISMKRYLKPLKNKPRNPRMTNHVQAFIEMAKSKWREAGSEVWRSVGLRTDRRKSLTGEEVE